MAAESSGLGEAAAQDLGRFALAKGEGPIFDYGLVAVRPKAVEDAPWVALAVIGEDADGELVVALPGGAWHRTASRRSVPTASLKSPRAFSVRLVNPEAREQALEATCRVWVAGLRTAWAQLLDFVAVGEEDLDLGYSFGEGEQLDCAPFAEDLIEVAGDRITYQTAAEGDSPEHSARPASEGSRSELGWATRVADLERDMGQVQQGIKDILAKLGGGPTEGANQQQPAPSRPSALRPTSRGKAPPPSRELGGLDPAVVQAARAAGVPDSHLQEMARVVQGTRTKLKDPQAPAKALWAPGPGPDRRRAGGGDRRRGPASGRRPNYSSHREADHYRREPDGWTAQGLYLGGAVGGRGLYRRFWLSKHLAEELGGPSCFEACSPGPPPRAGRRHAGAHGRRLWVGKGASWRRPCSRNGQGLGREPGSHSAPLSFNGPLRLDFGRGGGCFEPRQLRRGPRSVAGGAGCSGAAQSGQRQLDTGRADAVGGARSSEQLPWEADAVGERAAFHSLARCQDGGAAGLPGEGGRRVLGEEKKVGHPPPGTHCALGRHGGQPRHRGGQGGQGQTEGQGKGRRGPRGASMMGPSGHGGHGVPAEFVGAGGISPPRAGILSEACAPVFFVGCYTSVAASAAHPFCEIFSLPGD